MTFTTDLKVFADKTNAKANTTVRAIVFMLDAKLVFRSPVGDALFWKSPPPPGYVGGKFRANWQIGIDEVNGSTANAPEEKDGVVERHQAETEGRAFAGYTTYLTNSVEYARRLEDGWSQRQAPAGIVGLSVIEFEPVVKAAVAAAKAV